jgi:hypothetical protein
MSKETRYRNVMHHRQYPLDELYFTWERVLEGLVDTKAETKL